MSKSKVLFIVQDDDGACSAASKEDVETHIKMMESSDQELDFKVIGKIPSERATMDVSVNDIEFYQKESVDKPLADKAILAIIQYLQ